MNATSDLLVQHEHNQPDQDEETSILNRKIRGEDSLKRIDFFAP